MKVIVDETGSQQHRQRPQCPHNPVFRLPLGSKLASNLRHRKNRKSDDMRSANVSTASGSKLASNLQRRKERNSDDVVSAEYHQMD